MLVKLTSGFLAKDHILYIAEYFFGSIDWINSMNAITEFQLSTLLVVIISASKTG